MQQFAVCAYSKDVNGQLSRSHGKRTRHDHAPQGLPSAPVIIPRNSKAIQLRVPQRLIRTDGEGKKIISLGPQETISGGEENRPPIDVVVGNLLSGHLLCRTSNME
jgi:hypothetical protein